MPSGVTILAVGDAERWFFRRIMRGVFDYCREWTRWRIICRGYPTLTEPSGYDGILGFFVSAEQVHACLDAGVPAATFADAVPTGGLSHVIHDSRAVGRVAADHALRRGFRHFAYVGSGRDRWDRLRLDGWTKRLRARGAGLAGVLREEDDVAAQRRWLTQLPFPTAVLCNHDPTAARVLEACAAAGLAVPEQVAVIGVNNDAMLCETARPTLTSVDLNWHLLGYQAARELDRRLRDPQARWRVVRIRPGELVARQSTAPPAADDLLVARAAGYVRDHVWEPLTVAMLARALKVPRRRLELRVRRALGRSPHDLIREARLKRACELLEETDLPLHRVAAASGFTHQRYFSTHFRRQTGLTPSAYRRRARQ